MKKEYLKETEKQIIGGIIEFGFSDVYCTYAIENLVAEDFYENKYRQMFVSIKSAYKRNEQLDKVILMRETLITDSEFVDIALSCHTTANFKSYVEILKERSRENRILSGVTSITKADNKFKALEHLYFEEKKMHDAETLGDQQENAKYAIEFLEYIHEPNDTKTKIYTGFSSIDDYLGGLRKKSISVVGAYPSTGKTAIALNIANHQTKQGKKALFVSLEMSRTQIYERLVADNLSINYSRIGKKDLEKNELKLITAWVEKFFTDGNFLVCDDIMYIEDIERNISKHKPDLVVIDFVQRIKTHRKCNSRREEVDYISSQIKSLAMAYNCHIMTLSQLARKQNATHPTMSDLKESGSLEQDNDYVMLLHRPNVADKSNDFSETYLTIDKNKYGRTGRKQMHFNGGFQRFTEVVRI